MRGSIAISVGIAAALAGLAFSSVSTHDFMKHLDRGTHGLNCSFLPGVGDTDTSDDSGCYVTLMSLYSSVLRDSVWGGIPVSLPAMAVFGFLLAYGVFVLLTRRQQDRRANGFMIAAWTLPVLTSIGMGYLSLATLDAACKLCIGIYAASLIGFLAAVTAFFFAPRTAKATAARFDPDRLADDTVPDETAPDDRIPYGDSPQAPPIGWGVIAIAFVVGVLFVLVPVATYAAAAPDFSLRVNACGTLPSTSDPNEVLIPIGPQTRPIPVIEVLDPLCPSCRGFEQRFDASTISADVSRKVLLFPLDNACNWMIDSAMHPGACAVSEAILCAEQDAADVINWAFENQEALLEAAREDPESAAASARAQFPALADCIGSTGVRARLNQVLRWAVDKQLHTVTPQVFVGHLRLCNEDTDLGMDYALAQLAQRYQRDPQPPATEAEEDETATMVVRPPTAMTRPTEPVAPSTPAEPSPAAPAEAAQVPPTMQAPTMQTPTVSPTVSPTASTTEPDPAAPPDPPIEPTPQEPPSTLEETLPPTLPETLPSTLPSTPPSGGEQP